MSMNMGSMTFRCQKLRLSNAAERSPRTRLNQRSLFLGAGGAVVLGVRAQRRDAGIEDDVEALEEELGNNLLGAHGFGGASADEAASRLHGAEPIGAGGRWDPEVQRADGEEFERETREELWLRSWRGLEGDKINGVNERI
ncbi:hypothetical protein ACLOJK_036945 [Asimina triloba]